MPKITIDGKEIEAAPGTSLIRAARDAGIHIPHYCWHPRLTVAGNCRMCLVEIEGMPKLVTSCTTEIRDGQVVHTKNANVAQAQKAVLEFLLLNHPLDCPICDKAGECMLQDWYFRYSAEDSRLEVQKVHKPKNLDIGRHIILDQERCILCTRCVRFMEEVAHDPVLGVIERGDRSRLTVFPDRGLDNRYALNTADICPVGALTSKEFRFRKRVWFLQHTRSVCPNCARGCPVILDHEGRRVYRMMPGMRDGETTWLCDPGRLGFDFIHEADRPRTPVLREEGPEPRILSWDETAREISKRIGELQSKFGAGSFAGICSNTCSNEEIFAFIQLVTGSFGSRLVSSHNPVTGLVDSGPEDRILVRGDKNPNSRGADEIPRGFEGGLADFHQIIRDAHDGKIKAMWIVDSDFLGRVPDNRGRKKIMEALQKVRLLIVQSPLARDLHAIAHVILPAATWAESEGTFVNFEGRVQKFLPAFPPLGQGLPGLEIFRRVAAETGRPLPASTPAGVFDLIARQVPAFRGLDYRALDRAQGWLEGCGPRGGARSGAGNEAVETATT